ncbi:hypothetical protein GCM10018787_45300 [Streptomyces thermodiastaticus]|nr:hypothetical protein GCM10018787_45300 [Streptomyces thermodiastaticus]
MITPDGTRWRYTYDPLGRRTAKLRLAEDGETVVERVDFTWDGTTLCEQTTTSPDLPHPVALTWDHQGLRPISQTERLLPAADASQEEIDSRFFAIVTDLVGTPTELVDEHGHLAWRARSTLWGTTAWAANSTAYTPLRFPGQYYDPQIWSDHLGLAPDVCPEEEEADESKLKLGEIYVYRVVMDDELKDIPGPANRRYRNLGGAEVKYFSTTPEGAAACAREAFHQFRDKVPYTLTRGVFREDVIRDISRIPNLADAGGKVDSPMALSNDEITQIGRVRILPYTPIV